MSLGGGSLISAICHGAAGSSPRGLTAPQLGHSPSSRAYAALHEAHTARPKRALASASTQASLENTVAELGTTPELLSSAGAECGFRGERRALRVRLNDLTWSLEGAVLTLGFWLPPGSYATSVLREVVKSND